MLVFGYILATMWTLGCVVLPLYCVYHLWNDYEKIMAWAVLLVGFPLSCVLGVLPWAAFEDSRDPHISLNKTEWFCTQDHIVPVTTYVKSGSVMVPITSHHRVCTQYNKK